MTETSKWIWQPPTQSSVAIIDLGGNHLAEKLPVNRIFCVGRNYEAHAREMNAELDREAPFYFTKTPSAIACEVNTIPYPPGTENFHHEVELVIALGADGFKVSENKAEELIFGYACGIDFTRRDLQNKAKEGRKPWDLSKDIEFGAVISAVQQWPANKPLREAKIELSVNGEGRQDSNIQLMVWSIREIIAHLSNFYHLTAGDLIYTGTPAGVGPVNVGDHIQASITNIGVLDLMIRPPLT